MRAKTVTYLIYGVLKLLLLLILALLLSGCGLLSSDEAAEADPEPETTAEVTAAPPAEETAVALQAPISTTVSSSPTAMVTPRQTTPTPPPVTPSPTITPTATPLGPNMRLVQPQQVSGYLPNPGMGWQDTLREGKRFPETVGYTRLNWREVNPTAGEYDWGAIESLRRHMAEQGSGQISFRIRTTQPPPWGQGDALPQWVIDMGIAITQTESDIEPGVFGPEPIYHDCQFLAAHATLIEAMRQQFDGDPDIVFIDIGSYGGYGEWWSEQYNEEPESLDWHARRRIVDMYIGGQEERPCLAADGQSMETVAYNYPGFQQTRLIMPYTPWFEDSLEYALSQRYDIGLRHDALGSASHQETFRNHISELVAETWPRAPIIFEYYPESHTPEALQRGRDFAIDMHASFIHENFDGQGNSNLIEDLLEEVGYRLVLQQIVYLAQAQPGQPLPMEMIWQNVGLAPAYFNTYPLAVYFTDSDGNTVAQTIIEELDLRTWFPSEEIMLATQLNLPADLAAGSYNLQVAFIDPQSEMPALNLAIAGRDEIGRYTIATVEIAP